MYMYYIFHKIVTTPSCYIIVSPQVKGLNISLIVWLCTHAVGVNYRRKGVREAPDYRQWSIVPVSVPGIASAWKGMFPAGTRLDRNVLVPFAAAKVVSPWKFPSSMVLRASGV